MRHAAQRMRVQIRRGRVVAALASALTVSVAVLASSGVLPTPTPADLALTASDEPRAQIPERGQSAADRSQRFDLEDPDEAASTGNESSPARPDVSEQTPSTPAQPSATPTPTPSASPTADEGELLPPHDAVGKRIVYRLSTNHVWLVDADGEVVRDYLVSGTKFGQVDPGTYEVLRKRRYTRSFHLTEKMEYMVTFTEGENAAIGFHNIPVSIDTGRPVQSLTQLGTSLSAGCVRQQESDAKALWEFAPVGTPVIVLA